MGLKYMSYDDPEKQLFLGFFLHAFFGNESLWMDSLDLKHILASC